MTRRSNLVCGLASLGLVFSVNVAGGQSKTIFDSGPVFIGMTETKLQRDVPPKSVPLSESGGALSEILARMAQELLPTYIQRVFEMAWDRQVLIVPVASLPVTEGSDTQFLTAGVSATVIDVGSLGVRVTAKVVTGRGPSDRTVSEDDLLISPSTTLGQLDEKISEFAFRLAKRLLVTKPPPEKAGVPRGVIGFHCVVALDSSDRKLQQLARRLTIDLPFQLSEVSRKRGLDLIVRGLDISEALGTCEGRSFSGTKGTSFPVPQLFDARIENFSLIGSVHAYSNKKDSAQFTLRASNRDASENFRPISDIDITDMSSPEVAEIAEKILDDFVLSFSVHYQTKGMAPAQTAEPVLVADTSKRKVLVDAAHGMTLYTWDRDTTPGKSACNGQCATKWPPLLASDNGKAAGNWTIVVRDDGKKQWAYKGKPLYFWKDDKKAGDVDGDNRNNIWHVVANP